jgi:formylglycine-generating enzyme required for sulfatase activity
LKTAVNIPSPLSLKERGIKRGELILISLIFLTSCLWDDTLYEPEKNLESITIEAFAADTTGVEDSVNRESIHDMLKTEMEIRVGETVTFLGFINGDTSLVEVKWEFGDGDQVDITIAEHSYDSAGDYNAVFIVTDKAKFSVSDNVIVEVKEVTDGGVKGWASFEGKLWHDNIEVTLISQSGDTVSTKTNRSGLYEIPENLYQGTYTIIISDAKYNAYPSVTIEDISVEEGKLTEISEVVLRDTVEPQIFAIEPTGEITYRQPVVQANFSDSVSGIAPETFLLVFNGDTVTETYLTKGPSGFNWTPADSLPDGEYEVMALIKDSAGNATERIWIFTVAENSPPTAPVIIYPAHNGDTIWADDILKWSLSIDSNGPAEYRLTLVDSMGETVNRTLGDEIQDTSFNFKGFDLLDIEISLQVTALDNGGDIHTNSQIRTTFVKYRGVMKKIPGGTFQMGSNTGIDPMERPVHTVTVSSFWMDTVEVTQGEYSLLMGDTYAGYSEPAWEERHGRGADYPVRDVNWYDAVLYCNARSKHDGLDTVYIYTSLSGIPGNDCRLNDDIERDTSRNGYRLPTEAEWEYACRAGTATEYYWGDNMDTTYAWYPDNCGNTTHPVGKRLPNSWGLYDMSGNVWEWVNDRYGPYSISTQTDPIGFPSGSERVLRGGSFSNDNDFLRSATRFKNLPYQEKYCYGFRCVR